MATGNKHFYIEHVLNCPLSSPSPFFTSAITLGKLKINLFGAFFGLWEVFWGALFWYPVTSLYGFARAISSKLPGDLIKRIDPFRRFPCCVGYIWAVLSFSPWLLWPKLEGRENLDTLREVDENGKKGWVLCPYIRFRDLSQSLTSKCKLKPT